MTARIGTYGFLLLLAAAALVSGCEEQVTAPTGTDEPFSMYGVLNPRLNAQTLLVSPVEPLLHEYTDTIDAVVTSTRLKTGEVIVWKDSVARNAQGQIDHVFVARFEPHFNEKYRIRATRSDDASSFLDVQVPDSVAISLRNLSGGYADVIVSSASAQIQDAEIIYTVRWNPRDPDNLPCTFTESSYAFSYKDEIREQIGATRIRINMAADYRRVYERYAADHPISIGYLRVNGLALMEMEIRAFVVQPPWVPIDESLESTVHSHPGATSNVANGYGFIGAGYHELQQLNPSSSNMEASEFRDYLSRRPDGCRNFCRCVQ